MASFREGGAGAGDRSGSSPAPVGGFWQADSSGILGGDTGSNSSTLFLTPGSHGIRTLEQQLSSLMQESCQRADTEFTGNANVKVEGSGPNLHYGGDLSRNGTA